MRSTYAVVHRNHIIKSAGYNYMVFAARHRGGRLPPDLTVWSLSGRAFKRADSVRGLRGAFVQRCRVIGLCNARSRALILEQLCEKLHEFLPIGEWDFEDLHLEKIWRGTFA
jgi:hypothetical protein